MSDLRPCPFCNSATGPKIWDCVSADFSTGKSFWIYCGGCGVTTPHWPSTDELVKRWNTRATEGIEEQHQEIHDQVVDACYSALERAGIADQPDGGGQPDYILPSIVSATLTLLADAPRIASNPTDHQAPASGALVRAVVSQTEPEQKP